MSADIPFGAHPPSGAPPPSVPQASSYFGAPSGNSPTDANPFHFVGGAPSSGFNQVTQQPPPLAGPSSFFQQPNPSVNIFNPGASSRGEGNSQPPQQNFIEDAFGVSSINPVGTFPPQTSGQFPPSSDAPHYGVHGVSSVGELHSHAPPPPAAAPQEFVGDSHTPSAAGDDRDDFHQATYQRHSSAPSIPAASGLFSAPPTDFGGGGQPGQPSGDLFSSFAPQPNSLPASTFPSDLQSRPPPATMPRPFSQEPPSPGGSQSERVGSPGSLSAPSTTLHRILSPASDFQQEATGLSQRVTDQTSNTESSSQPVTPPYRPPSNADTADLSGAHVYLRTNADVAESSDITVPALHSGGIRPNQVHPSLTEDLGITNASHGSQANLRTNVNTGVSIGTAVDEATPSDSSGQERKSSLNLDSSLNKSVSSLLDGSQEDFSSYSPIRLLPPAPVEGEDPIISHQLTEPYANLGGSVPLKPAVPDISGGTHEELTKLNPYSTERGHEKKASDDLKDWEIVDSIPPASDLSQLPGSVKLLPPSSFTSAVSEPLKHSGGPTLHAPDGGISTAMGQLTLESYQTGGDSVQHTVASNLPSGGGVDLVSSSVPAPSDHPHSLPVSAVEVVGGDKASPVAPLSTNITNLQTAPPTHQPRSSHAETRLSSTLPEPKDISSLITQIPFLTPHTSSSQLGTGVSSTATGVLQGVGSRSQVHPPTTGSMLMPQTGLTGPTLVASAGQTGSTGQPGLTSLTGPTGHTGPTSLAGPTGQGSGIGQTGISSSTIPSQVHSNATNLEPSNVSARQSGLPPPATQPIPAAVTNTPPPSVGGHLPQPAHITPSTASVSAATQQYTPVVTNPAPQPQTTSAFAHVQPQQQKEQLVHQRPNLNPHGHGPGEAHKATSLPTSTVSLSTSLTAHPSQPASIAATFPPVETTSAVQAPPTSQPPIHPPLTSSSTSVAAPPSVEAQQTRPEQQQGASSAPSTTSSQNAPRASVDHHHEGFEPPHSHRHDDHGYYHDPYYDHERESYYGGDRHRAPSAFSEWEAESYYQGYHPRQDGRQRSDYSHHPDHPGYRTRPGYRYDEPYGRRGGYPPHYGRPPMRDEYGMPIRPPYHDPYDPYGYNPRYGYGGGGGHYPPPPHGDYYGMEYPQDPHYDYHRHPPSEYEHDPRLYQESGYDSHAHSGYDSHTHGQQQQYAYDELNPAETSAIAGQTDNFEMSQFVDSPNVRLPGRPHPQEVQHNSTAYLDPQQQQQEYGGQHHEVTYPGQMEGQYHGEQDYHQEQGYAEGSWYYPHDPHYGDAQASYYGDQGHEFTTPAEPPVETTPPPPPRATPELFAHPHVRATFGFGGQLVTVIPSYPGVSQSPLVEITILKDVINDDETVSLVEAVESSAGPFIPGDTPKSHVVRFASREAQKCREKMSEVEGDQEAYNKLEDEALLWDFLVLLCQQNGVVVSSDISELLLKEGGVPTSKPVAPLGATTTQEESLDAIRQLLFAGRKKDAVDTACSRGLWGHALMLASRMDEQTRTYVVNRFTASLLNTDPLSTFYTLLLGRTPSAVKVEGLPRAGDWKPHLAMILANRMSKLENGSIVSLGYSLLSQNRLHAAHLCYHLASVHFGAYGSTDSKYSLLGTDHSRLITGAYPQPCDLHMMEVLEFAMSLSKQDFLMPNFQLFKFLHVVKLLELGFVSQALKYCEQISCAAIVKSPHCFAPVFLHVLLEASVRLYHLSTPFDLMESSELPSWLYQLQQVVSDALSTDYAPGLFSPSPAFSSVSQTYGDAQRHSQPIIGLQANTTGGYLSVPGTAGGSRVESGTSSKEGSVINMKIDYTTSHLTMGSGPPPPPPESNDNTDGSTLPVQGLTNASEPIPQQQQVQEDGGAQTVTQRYDPSQYQSPYDPNFSLATSQHQQPQALGSTNGQPHVQAETHQGMYQSGDGGVNYGQYGASAEGQGVAMMSTNFQQDPIPTFPGGYTQTQVSQGQLFYGAVTQPLAQDGGTSGMGAESRVEQEVTGGDGASATGDHGMGGQVVYGEYYGQPSTGQAQPSSEHPSSLPPSSQLTQPAPTQGGYPSQTGYGYNQWDQPVQSHDNGVPSEDVHRKRQQELESSSKTEAESRMSGDSHVTEKKEEDEKNKDQKSSKGDKQPQAKSSGGGGWGIGGFLKRMLPKMKNQAHLPDDKNPTIIWDEDKNQWVDLTADPTEQAGPPPPPTDSQLTQTRPTTNAPPPSGREGGPMGGAMTSSTSTQPGSSLPAGGGAEGTDGTVPTKSSYSMQRSRRGLRSKYVDVLNPGGSKPRSGSGGPPPPGPPLMGAMMAGPPQPFTGTFFVPQQPPDGDDQSGSGDAAETPPTNSTPSAPDTTNEIHTRGATSESAASNQHIASSNVTGGVSQSREAVGAPTPVQEQYLGQQGVSSWQQDQSSQSVRQALPQEAQRDTAASDAPTPTPQFPQLFNPNAFAPVTAFPPGLPGSSTTEPQDDAMSSVSLISESSQEVSQYMSKQAPSTSSAGYSWLKRGIRGVQRYPQAPMPGGGVQQQRPHPGHAPIPAGSGPPQFRNPYQPMQPMQ